MRVSCALFGQEALETFSEPKTALYQHRLNIRSKKIFIDGALGSRGAWLTQPYHDEPKSWGFQLCNEKQLLELVRSSIQKRFQLIFHTLGDQSSQWVLKTLAKKYKPQDLSNKRFRFEHLEVIQPKTISLMKDFGMIASVQPWHALSDSAWLEKRLGQERLDQVSVIKKMVMGGLHVCGGSDAPIEPHDPMKGLYAAILRRPLSNKSNTSWLLSQRLTVKEAIKMYTIEGAYAEFLEHVKGTLELGKLADFAVLSDDIFDMHPRYFLEVKNLMTVVGGKIVYEQ